MSGSALTSERYWESHQCRPDLLFLRGPEVRALNLRKVGVGIRAPRCLAVVSIGEQEVGRTVTQKSSSPEWNQSFEMCVLLPERDTIAY